MIIPAPNSTMPRGFVATARAQINAPVETVWDAFTNPEKIKQYMFGTDVVSDWNEGSPIVWKGIWNGKAYEDKGRVLEFRPMATLSYSHFSPLSGLQDAPENYHTVKVELSSKGGGTSVMLSQDNNPTDELRAHSQKNWEAMLAGLKSLLESRP